MPTLPTVAQTTGKPTLTLAVETVVADFIKAGKQFSAHDITNEIRARVGAGTLTVDKAEVGVVHVAGGTEVARIGHDSVKGLVHDLYDGGQMTGYTRVSSGQFFTYAPDPVAVTADPVTPVAPPAADGSSYSGDPTL